MRAWLRRGAAAASLASGRSDLWPAASLAWLAYLGWPPLLLAVAPPQVPDVAQLVVQVESSGIYPFNVVALCIAAVTGFMLLCLLVALAEATLIRALAVTSSDGPSRQAGDQPTLMAMAVILLASTPVLIAVAWLALSTADVAPAVYTEPGPAATVPARLAARLLPQLCVVLIAVLVAQAIGGLALRRALLRPAGVQGGGPGAAILAGARRIGRRPAPWLGLAGLAWVKDVLLLLFTWWLLSLLWPPIGESLGAGLLSSPQALVLLVGFVAIWLSLLLAGGALHAFVSAWWLAEWRSTEDG